MVDPPGNFFAALPVEVPAGMLESLRRGAPDGLRWFHPDDLHVTLAFFGREDPQRFGALRDVLGRVPFRGREITLGPLRPLPSRRRIRVLALAIGEGHDELAELIGAWRGPLCQAAGVEPASRPPLPHLTVARLHRRRTDPRAVMRWLDGADVPSRTVARVSGPALYGWSADRPARQFRFIMPTPGIDR